MNTELEAPLEGLCEAPMHLLSHDELTSRVELIRYKREQSAERKRVRNRTSDDDLFESIGL